MRKKTHKYKCSEKTLTVQVQERFFFFFLNVCVIIIMPLASHGTDEKQVEIRNIIATFWKKKIDEMAGRSAGRAPFQSKI